MRLLQIKLNVPGYVFTKPSICLKTVHNSVEFYCLCFPHLVKISYEDVGVSEEKQQLLLDEKQKNKIEKMLTKEKNKLEKTFKVKLQNALENEKKELENAIMEKYKEEYQKREHDLEKTFKVKMQNEKKDIEKVVWEKCDQEYQKAKADLERSFKEKFAKMEESQAESSIRAERSRLEEEKAGLKKKMETDLCHTIERRLEVLILRFP